ncbi:MAG: hypothetical protein HYV51_00400 [Parcubacteria group bacterium]|nr:hypothetical protein [Parcubacteria group bacterium]
MKNQKIRKNKILGGGEPNLRSKFGAKEFYFFLFSGFFLVATLLFTAVPVSAQVIGNFDFLKGIVPCDTSYASAPCTVCHFYKLLQNIINFLLLMSTSLVTLMAIYIGFLFLFSGGSQKNITDAKSKLWLLVWGLVWVLGSWLVLNTVINFFTVIGKPGPFPTPWNQISCEISKSSGGENPGGGNPGGGTIDFSDHIFDDVHIAVDTKTDVVTVVDESESKTTTFDLSEGTGIAYVRDKYPNVFIIGGDIPMQNAVKLREGLDLVYAQLPDEYKNLKNSYILVSANQEMHDQMVIASGGDPKNFQDGRSFVSNVENNNTMVLGSIAGGETSYSIKETLVHELAHQRDGALNSGRHGGDIEWEEIYFDAKEAGAFVSDYAKTNKAEDLAETITVATLGDDAYRMAYTGNGPKDEILAKKYEYLKNKGYIKNIPPR